MRGSRARFRQGANARDQSGGAVSCQEIDQDDLPAVLFDHGSFWQRAVAIISAFNVDFRLQGENQIAGYEGLEDDGSVHTAQRCHESRPFACWNERTASSLERFGCRITIDAHKQGVARSPRFFEVIQVSNVEQVEVTVCKHQYLVSGTQIGALFKRLR